MNLRYAKRIRRNSASRFAKDRGIEFGFALFLKLKIVPAWVRMPAVSAILCRKAGICLL